MVRPLRGSGHALARAAFEQARTSGSRAACSQSGHALTRAAFEQARTSGSRAACSHPSRPTIPSRHPEPCEGSAAACRVRRNSRSFGFASGRQGSRIVVLSSAKDLLLPFVFPESRSFGFASGRQGSRIVVLSPAKDLLLPVALAGTAGPSASPQDDGDDGGRDFRRSYEKRSRLRFFLPL